jgi:CubicO group peptidase (beta-lactamase class C family)
MNRAISRKGGGTVADSVMLPRAIAMRLVTNIRHSLLQATVSVSYALLLVGSCAGQNGRQEVQGPASKLRQQISQVAAKYKIPGIAVAVIKHGQLHEMEVFGVRDQKSGVPVAENTVFEAGSLGEPLYAYSVLRLAAEGHFNVGAPLPASLPLPYVRNLNQTSASSVNTEPIYDPRLNRITAIAVMNHTSGMPDWARNQHLHLQSSPGEKWSYSNEGYIYLQQAVEHATGETFDAFLLRSVFAPAGMSRSSFVWRSDYEHEVATGYDKTGTTVASHRYSRPAAAATLYTTVEDYAQFVAMLLASAPAQRAHESAVSLMLNPTVRVDDTVPFSWGLGVGLENSGDDAFFFHRDRSAGFQSFWIASRNTGNGVVIFTNSGNGLDAVPEIVAATIGGNHQTLKSAFVRSQ